MSILSILDVGLALMGWLFIMFKTGQWFISIALKQWDKRRKQLVDKKQLTNFMMRLTCQVSSQVQPLDLRLKAT